MVWVGEDVHSCVCIHMYICGIYSTHMCTISAFLLLSCRLCILKQTQIEQDFHYSRKTSYSLGCSCHSDVNAHCLKPSGHAGTGCACSSTSLLSSCTSESSSASWLPFTRLLALEEYSLACAHRQTDRQGKHCCNSTPYTYTHMQYCTSKHTHMYVYTQYTYIQYCRRNC